MKRAIISVITIIMTFSVIGVVNAQDPPRPDQRLPRGVVALSGAVYEAAAEALGMTPVEVIQNADPGQSLNDYLVANGIDPVVVATTASATATETINQAVLEGVITQEQADQMITNLDDSIARIMEHPVPNVQRARVIVQLEMIVVQAAADELGMSLVDLMRASEPGQALRDVIMTNGGNPAAVTAAAIATATTQIEEALASGNITSEQAEQMLANLENAVESSLDRPLPRPRHQPGERGPGRQLDLVQVVADELSVTSEALMAELQSGKTLRQVIDDHGGNVDAISEVLLNAMRDNFRQRIENLLDRQWDREQRGAGGQPRRQGGGGPGVLE